MPTLRLDLAYDGSGFRGYAHQEGLRTVQRALEDALNTMLDGPVETAVAGRTDAGVHARGQVVSFRAQPPIDVERLARSLNGLVGPEIAVMAITEVDDGFDARFSARWRRYRYSMFTGSVPDPLTRRLEWHVGPRLDHDAMAAAATEFVGEHDFSAFCHQMVRSLVGLCYDVGRGFTPVELVREIVESADRSRVATVAPPHGLVLWEVGY